MGKPKTTNSKADRSKKAKSNPFAVKKYTKKAKKKIKPSLELLDKTFGDLQGQSKTQTSAKKSNHGRTLEVAQEPSDTNKSDIDRSATPSNVDQLVKDTAQARI